ncbi:MAG TPA: hypothetical protein VMN77_02040 [Nitrospiria bacterium]|jgi:hypothetical protein|nr:hypothetical protein [Nitrospiria bacterium]
MSNKNRGCRLAIWMILAVSALGLAHGGIRGAVAGESGALRFQGVIMEHQGSTLIVNEHTLLLTATTKVMAPDKTALRADRLAQGQWIAVEAEQTAIGLRARAIVLLPKPVRGAEESLFTVESE